MSKQFIETVLLALAKERRVFWSEADFQFAFAWKLKEMFKDRNPQSAINVRLERRADALKKKGERLSRARHSIGAHHQITDLTGRKN